MLTAVCTWEKIDFKIKFLNFFGVVFVIFPTCYQPFLLADLPCFCSASRHRVGAT